MISPNWRRAYDAWKATGLTRIDFHKTRFKCFFPDETPCLTTLYRKFKEIERLLESVAAERSAASQIGTVAVATLPAVTPRKVATKVGRNIPVKRISHPSGLVAREVRLILPNGSLLEFRSESPELMAIGMMQAAGVRT